MAMGFVAGLMVGWVVLYKRLSNVGMRYGFVCIWM